MCQLLHETAVVWGVVEEGSQAHHMQVWRKICLFGHKVEGTLFLNKLSNSLRSEVSGDFYSSHSVTSTYH